MKYVKRTREEKEYIYDMMDKGMSYEQIAEKTGLKRSCVAGIIQRYRIKYLGWPVKARFWTKVKPTKPFVPKAAMTAQSSSSQCEKAGCTHTKQPRKRFCAECNRQHIQTYDEPKYVHKGSTSVFSNPVSGLRDI